MGSNPPGRAGETVLGPPIVVTVSPDHLEAYLQADPRQPEGLSRERALALLKESRVVFGVEEKAVELALNEYQGKKVLVARGKPVEHGRDGEIV
ncbi:MAG: FapA family protein, partial [Syntrophomonadaceae bacterium]|nr:FapA family protein [Syntrophomonadaceae bacterium]